MGCPRTLTTDLVSESRQYASERPPEKGMLIEAGRKGLPFKVPTDGTIEFEFKSEPEPPSVDEIGSDAGTPSFIEPLNHSPFCALGKAWHR